MPTNRRRRVRGQVAQLPDWMVAFLKDGTVPDAGTEDHQQYLNWTLLPGYSDFYKLGWPEPPQ